MYHDLYRTSHNNFAIKDILVMRTLGLSVNPFFSNNLREEYDIELNFKKS